MKCALLVMFPLIALAQDKPRVIEGSVVNSVTGAGIEGASITITLTGRGIDALKPSATVTDAAGSFHISGIAPGDYRVQVQKTGFSSPPPVSPIPGTPSLRVDAATDPPRLRLELIPPGILRGRGSARTESPRRKCRWRSGLNSQRRRSPTTTAYSSSQASRPDK